MKSFKLFFILISFPLIAKSQIYSRPFVDMKLLVDLNIKKNGNISHCKLLVSAGAKNHLNPYRDSQKSSFFVTPVTTLSILLGKGIGSSMLDKKFKFRPQFNVNLNFTTEWGDTVSTDLQHRIEGAPYLIENGFKSDRKNLINLSTSQIFISPFDKSVKSLETQRVGGIFIGIDRFSGSYFNDGPPFGKWSGDKLDRWFTGTGHAGWNFHNKKTLIKNEKLSDFLNPSGRKEFRLSFARFTGYEKDSYEYNTALLNDYIIYKDDNVMGFNRGLFGLHYYNDSMFYGIVLNDNDVLDVQNIIHRVRLMAFHRSINKHSVSFEGGFYNKFK